MGLEIPKELIEFKDSIVQNDLKFEVISCVQAAKAKGFPLRNELKTLLINTSKGLYVTNILGDQKLNLRKVKQALGCKQARLASPQILKKLGLVPGTVCAIKDPVWELPSLIESSLLDLKFTSTNDGTRTGYVVLNEPKILLVERNGKKPITGNFGT